MKLPQPPMPPTLETYTALQAAFDHFNAALFDNMLPQCLITLRSSKRTHGYMHQRRFVNLAGSQIDELGINPGFFAVQSTEEVMATLVHEMVHHWQNHFGSPSKSVPHNREWADKMESIGLIPSDTGLPGGRRTGRSMNDYISTGGVFLAACESLTTKGLHLPWLDRHLSVMPDRMSDTREQLLSSGVASVGGQAPLAKAASAGVNLDLAGPPLRLVRQRIRQICPECEVSAWTAPGVAITCGTCDEPMEEQSLC
jgi:hypothetical protein